MAQYELLETVTRDGVTLAGIAAHPAGKRRVALIWLHGLGSSLTHGQRLAAILSRACVRNSIGYFKYSNRGHDIVNHDGKPGQLLGVAHERFEDCVLDIRAMLIQARKLGYREFILAGHSTGANKIVYAQSRMRDRRVRGLLLVAGLSDIAGEKRHRTALARTMVQAHRLIRARRGGELVNYRGHLYSARRFVSLYQPGQAEDVFPVHGHVQWTALRSIRVPIGIVFGNRDEYMDRPARTLADLYRAKAEKTQSCASVVIPGATHSFRRHERELTAWTTRWMRAVLRTSRSGTSSSRKV